jgi:hypothetical protein
MGSTNIVTLNDSDDDGFWAIEEKDTHAYIYCAEPDPEVSDMGSDLDDNNEAFHVELTGTKDKDALDWAGFEDQLVKKREDWCIEEEADMAILKEEDTSCSEAQPVPHHAQHAHVIMDTLAALGAPDEEEGCLPTASPRGEHDVSKLGWTLLERVWAIGCMGHTIWLLRQQQHMTQLEDRMAMQMQNDKMPSEALSWLAVNSSDEPMQGCNICAHHPGGPKLANIHMREDSEQFHSFDADVQAHQASWPGPDTATAKLDTHLSTAALLEREERMRAIGSSEQAAVLTTPSTFKTLKLPPLHAQSMPTAPERAPDPHIPSVQPHGGSRIHTPSRIKCNLNPQPSKIVAQSGAHAPHLMPCL